MEMVEYLEIFQVSKKGTLKKLVEFLNSTNVPAGPLVEFLMG